MQAGAHAAKKHKAESTKIEGMAAKERAEVSIGWCGDCWFGFLWSV